MKNPPGWTTETVKVLEDEKISALKELFSSEIRRLEAVIDGQVVAVSLASSAAQIAQDKFEAKVERDSVKQNEFRGALDDITSTKATRREMEVGFASLTARHDDLVKQVSTLTSRVDVGPVGLAALQTRADISAGRQQGVGVSANVVVIAATLLISVFGLAVAIYLATR